MDLAAKGHIAYFLWVLLLGGVLGVLYDFLRYARRIKPASPWRINLEDFLFLLMAGMALFALTYLKNDGRLRWQGFLGLAAGIGIYYLIFRNSVVHLLVYLHEWLRKCLAFVVRVVRKPFLWLMHMLSKPILAVIRYGKKRHVKRKKQAGERKNETT